MENMIKKESIFIALNAVSRPNLTCLKIWKCSALFYAIIFSFIYHLTTLALVHNHQNHTAEDPMCVMYAWEREDVDSCRGQMRTQASSLTFLPRHVSHYIRNPLFWLWWLAAKHLRFTFGHPLCLGYRHTQPCMLYFLVGAGDLNCF